MLEDRSGASATFLNSHADLNLNNFSGNFEISDIITPKESRNFSGLGALSSKSVMVLPQSAVSITASDSTAAETLVGQTSNAGRFTLTRTNDLTSSLTVGYSISGSATNGQDYDSLTGLAVFSAGSSTTFININVIDDSLYEAKETVQLTLATGSSYSLGKTKSATVNLNDNDKPTISIIASDASAVETLAGQTSNPGQFTLTRSGDATSSLSVNYLISGTAVNGKDYKKLTGNVTFAAGSSTAFVDINPISDGVLEGSEAVKLTLQSNNKYILNQSSASVLIEDPSIIAITSPNGGEALNINSTYNITWNDNIGENVKIELYKGGSFYSTINSSTLSDGSESWTVLPGIANGTDYTFKITSLNNSNLFDFSNGNFSISGPTDWFTQNLKDLELADLARTLATDGQLNRNDVIDILRNVKDSNVIDTYEFTDLKAIFTNAARFNIQGYVLDLFDKVINGDPANQKYQSGALGNLFAGSSDTQMENLIGKWFLGNDRPLSSYAYQYFSQPLFANGINPDDVRQGQVGDCYFLSTLASIANEQPQYIQDMFIDNGDNTFTVRFFNKGVAEYVTVDRYLPKASWGAAYANASTEMWVALAEKAYAQLAESKWSRNSTSTNAYDSISGGWMSWVIPQVTGLAAAQYKSIGSTTQTQLIALSNSNALLTVGFVNGTIAADGIINDHAYTITGYDAATGKFSLRNPWGYNHVSVTWDQLIANKAIFEWSV